MTKKNLISLFLSVAMLAGSCIPAFADTEGKVTYETPVITADMTEADTRIAELRATVPATASQLVALGYKKLADCSGVALYANTDEESENYGGIYFVLENGADGKVLFRDSIAKRMDITPTKGDEDYDAKLTKLFDSYYSTYFQSPHEYIAVTMSYIYESETHIMLVDKLTGAIAFIEKESGQILTTNPYDVGDSKANKETKAKLLSQFVFDYVRGQNGNTYTTFEQAARNNQIIIKRIRGGIRVEYTIGRQEARVLVPMMMEKERFESEILEKFTIENKAPEAGMTEEQLINQVEKDKRKLLAYYQLRDPDTYTSESAKRDILIKYPILQKYDFYEFNEQSSTRPKYEIEELIKEYTDYTYEQLQQDHELLEYQGNETNPPLFKMAIEYYLDDNGLKVRVPAKSISYNKSAFDITQLQILPFLGAGKQSETGYTFYPDGSGTLVRFEDIGAETKVISSKLYGQDYAYYAASGQNKEAMRLPVFGVKRDENYMIVDAVDPAVTLKNYFITDAEGAPIYILEKFDPTVITDIGGKDIYNEDISYSLAYGVEVTSKDDTFDPNADTKPYTSPDTDKIRENAELSAEDKALQIATKNFIIDSLIARENIDLPVNPKVDGRTAYLAYIEEGDSLVQLSTSHGGITHEYHSTYATVYPEMTDTYALTGISSSGDAKWTVGIERGYTGNYTFRIFMLDGDDANYVGMAQALREYLIDEGELVKSDAIDKDIPLFLENFGSIKTTQKVVGFPVTEHTQLTTFEQSKIMLEQLKEAGVSNINLKLTGWYNGGMEHTAPAKIKVQKAIGGEKGLTELSEYAKANGIGLFPDLDFTYVLKDGSFDGFNYKKDAVRTVDNKAASHRVYSALYQGFEDDKLLIINADRMLEIYEKIQEKYNSYGIDGLSVATLGSDLSSDNSKENAITREEAKGSVSELLAGIEESGNEIMVKGGNAYTYKYVDYITDLPVDSSRNIYTTEAIPFLGMVLHGSIAYTGSAVNLDGDYEYSVLKCIENGASPYFILSYTDDEVDNTSELKNFPLFSKYYSIKYNIWKEDLVETYKTLNNALKDVQTATISDHERIAENVVRVEYSTGKTFILNYDAKDYDYEGTKIPSLGFIVVND